MSALRLRYLRLITAPYRPTMSVAGGLAKAPLAFCPALVSASRSSKLDHPNTFTASGQPHAVHHSRSLYSLLAPFALYSVPALTDVFYVYVYRTRSALRCPPPTLFTLPV